jgi:hypothetical protein
MTNASLRVFLFAAALFFSTLAAAASPPCDEAADAKAQIQTASSEASKAKIPVLVVFGDKCARSMGDRGIYGFFTKVAAQHG